MNAYELAEKAEGLAYEIPADWSSGEPKNVATDIAAMLRQQADRIAELEKQGKPVAWMQMHYKDNIPTKFSPVKVWEDDIPLYATPQTKPLSNDEIGLLTTDKRWSHIESPLLLDFARAIEERHGIK